MPKDDNKGVIRIESILGGHAPTTHFAGADQFRASLGIDPSQPISDSIGPLTTTSCGLLRPTSASDLSAGTVIHNPPMFMESNPKDGNIFVYDAGGSVYTVDVNFTAVTGLGDLNDEQTASGNGLAYYDNYIYFACNTTVARYGPLNGSPAFTDNYWVSTLGKTRLSDNTSYPTDSGSGSVKYPNHVLHRHSDGKLYIADIVDNKGTIHYIATTKTTVEGDTDNGSSYNKIQVGYGLWPTCMESYGSDLVIAFYEGSGAGVSQTRAKVAFWDTISTNVNKITWVEFPDPYISAIKNIDGVLYVASGRVRSDGFRVSRFIGGYTFEEVAFFGTGAMPFPDAMDGASSQLIFGTFTDTPTTAGCLFSKGLSKASLGDGIFNIHRVSSSESSAIVTSLYLQDNWNIAFLAPTVGWATGDNGTSHNGIDYKSGYGNSENLWWSQVYRIGQRFKITKVTIPLATFISSSRSLVPTIYFDNGNTSQSLATINNTNYPSKDHIVQRPENFVGNHDFFLELKWTGTANMTVCLPITIEYELLDD